MIFCLILLILPLHLFSCSPEQKTSEDEIVARINDFPLTLCEYENQLAAVVNLNEDYKLTKEAKERFLRELIKKELLIQEAKKLQLDRKEKFIRSIEYHWESTLIKNLMEVKGEELAKRIVVSQDEIEAVYNSMKKSGETTQPLENLQANIIEKISGEKKTKLLIKWIDDLEKTAKVEVNEELLYQ